MNSLPKTVTRQRRGCDLNPGPSAPESSALTTRLPGHPFKSVTYWVPDSTTRTQTRTTPDKVHRLVGDPRGPNGLCRRLRQSGRGPAWLNLDTTMFVTRGFDGFGRNRPPLAAKWVVEKFKRKINACFKPSKLLSASVPLMLLCPSAVGGIKQCRDPPVRLSVPPALGARRLGQTTRTVRTADPSAHGRRSAAIGGAHRLVAR